MGTRPLPGQGLIFTFIGRGEWKVCVCAVLRSIHFQFTTGASKQLLILQSGLALTDLSNAAFSPVSGDY